MHKTKCLVKTPTYKAEVTLPDHCKEEIHWWIQSLSQWNGKQIISQEPDIVLETDASLEGWGFHCPQLNVRTGGAWNVHERKEHINALEMMAVDIAVKSVTKDRHKIHVHVKTDNVTTVRYVNKMGGTKSQKLTHIAKQIWPVLPHERDYDYCRTPAWNSQQNSGLGKQARVQRQHERLETESRYFQTNRSPSRAPRIGSVCEKNERPNRQIFQLETRPPGCGVGRIHQNLDRGKSVRVSPILPYSKSISKNTKGKCTNCADSTSLAHTSILPNASRTDCQQSNSITTSEGQCHPLVLNNTLKLVAWQISGELDKCKAFQQTLPSYGSQHGDQARSQLTTAADENGLAGVVRDKSIHFKPLWKM